MRQHDRLAFARLSHLPAYKTGTEKFLVVEQGKLRVVIEGQDHVLNAGDSLYFEADTPHRFDNTGTGICSYYLVVSSRA